MGFFKRKKPKAPKGGEENFWGAPASPQPAPGAPAAPTARGAPKGKPGASKPGNKPETKASSKPEGPAAAIFISAKDEAEKAKVLGFARHLAEKEGKSRWAVAKIGLDDPNFVQVLFDPKRVAFADLEEASKALCKEIAEFARPSLKQGDYAGVSYQSERGHKVQHLLLPIPGSARLDHTRLELDAADKPLKPSRA